GGLEMGAGLGANSGNDDRTAPTPGLRGISAQLGMLGNCGTSSAFAHLSRRLVNISSFGSMRAGSSRLPIVTKTVFGKLSRLLVKSRAPQSGQKFRSRPLPDSAT